jgi:hypothetical protein
MEGFMVDRSVEAVLATLGVIDLDGDILTRSAFPNGAEIMLSDFGHSVVLANALPVGRGRIYTEGDKLMLRGEYFDTERAVEAYETVKALGSLVEWSPTFRVMPDGRERPTEAMQKRGARMVITKAHPREASPVWMGAGVGTRTTAVKLGADEAYLKMLTDHMEQTEIRLIAARHRARQVRHDHRIRNRR